MRHLLCLVAVAKLCLDNCSLTLFQCARLTPINNLRNTLTFTILVLKLVIRLTFISTVCPIIIKHLFFMDVPCNWTKSRKKSINFWNQKETAPSDRHERCIVTCKKTACIFLSLRCDFGLDFSSFLTLLQMCLCHIGGPPMSAFVGLQ